MLQDALPLVAWAETTPNIVFPGGVLLLLKLFLSYMAPALHADA